MRVARLNAAILSIAVNLSMLVLKIAVSLWSGSIGILAEAIHSGFDLVASLMAYHGIKKAMEPSDREHHYGHYKYENLSSLLQSALMALTSFLIIYEAANRITKGAAVRESAYGMGLMVLTIAVAHFTSRYLHKVSVDEGSSALEADAYHFTTDVWSALSVLAGLTLVRLGFDIGDPLAAIFVALLMIYVAANLGRRAVSVMLDASPKDAVADAIADVIRRDGRVLSFHKFRARLSGSMIFVDVHIRLARNIHLKRAHAIAHELKRKILASNKAIEDVDIHLEPD